MNRSMIVPGALTVVGTGLGVWAGIWPLAISAALVRVIGVALEVRGSRAGDRADQVEAMQNRYIGEIESRSNYRSSGP